jgi:hypothetical protein
LLDTRLDARLFVGRAEERRRLAAAVAQGYNTLVWGEAGIGKTSFVRTFAYELRTAGRPVHYVRVEGADSGTDLLQQVASAVLAGRADAPGDVVGQREDVLLERLAAVPERPVIVVDDVQSAAGHALFGTLRDQLWALQWTWVVTVRTDDKGALLLPPASAFFERVIELPPLSAAEAVDMLRRRIGKPAPRWIHDVAGAAGGNPRRLLAVARDVTDNGGDADGIVAGLGERAAAIGRLGRPESMLAAELEALGAASASDDALLDRLGWTRARATQVFATLEKAGLVTSDEVRAGAGRPRRVFRLTPAADWAS